MKKITPYATIEDALASLDNGGRFFNLLAKAEDGRINPSEVVKVGGIFQDRQRMILFLELSLLQLNQAERETIISKLETDLHKAYRNEKPHMLLPAEVKSKGTSGSNVVITGTPKLIDAKSGFCGFMLFPVIKGKPNALSIISMADEYDVYELRDEASADIFYVAHVKVSEKLPNTKLTIGGILKEFNCTGEVNSPKKKFLEAFYYLDN